MMCLPVKILSNWCIHPSFYHASSTRAKGDSSHRKPYETRWRKDQLLLPKSSYGERAAEWMWVHSQGEKCTISINVAPGIPANNWAPSHPHALDFLMTTTMGVSPDRVCGDSPRGDGGPQLHPYGRLQVLWLESQKSMPHQRIKEVH